MRVAMIGTGTMGAGMARSLAGEGFEVTAWNRTRSRAESLAGDGIEVAESVSAAVRDADVVITMLYDTDAVLGVSEELLAALGPDAIWLQAATVGIEGMRRIAAAAGDVALLDAPMLGTKKPAEQGKLVPLVSGDPRLVERVTPVLEALGAHTVNAGAEVGQASALKLACNAWILSITAATAQSIAMTQAFGLDGSLFLQAIGGGATDSPYAQLKGNAMLEGDWTPSFQVDGGRKDLGLIAEATRAAGVDATLVEQVKAAFDRASEAGHGDDDLAAVRAGF